MWVWYIGGREAVEGKGGCSGVSVVQERRRLRGLL